MRTPVIEVPHIHRLRHLTQTRQDKAESRENNKYIYGQVAVKRPIRQSPDRSLMNDKPVLSNPDVRQHYPQCCQSSNAVQILDSCRIDRSRGRRRADNLVRECRNAHRQRWERLVRARVLESVTRFDCLRCPPPRPDNHADQWGVWIQVFYPHLALLRRWMHQAGLRH
jgi:hypothetical protein